MYGPLASVEDMMSGEHSLLFAIVLMFIIGTMGVMWEYMKNHNWVSRSTGATIFLILVVAGLIWAYHSLLPMIAIIASIAYLSSLRDKWKRSKKAAIKNAELPDDKIND
jgi:hypothetical protein